MAIHQPYQLLKTETKFITSQFFFTLYQAHPHVLLLLSSFTYLSGIQIQVDLNKIKWKDGSWTTENPNLKNVVKNLCHIKVEAGLIEFNVAI